MGGAAVSTNLANGSGAYQPNGSITYTSPNFSGFSLSAQGNNQTTTYGSPSVTIKKSSGYSLSYATGALSASFASNTISGAKAVNGIGASYDFGMAKVFISSLSQKDEDTATGYGVSVPFGAATLIASGSTQGDAQNYELVAKYNLSKRTLVYFQNTNKDTGVTGTSAVSTNSIGVRHDF
jgi:predicted porin